MASSALKNLKTEINYFASKSKSVFTEMREAQTTELNAQQVQTLSACLQAMNGALAAAAKPGKRKE